MFVSNKAIRPRWNL